MNLFSTLISIFLRKTSMRLSRGAARLGHLKYSNVKLPASSQFTLKYSR